MRRTTADEPSRNDRGLLMEAEALTPTDVPALNAQTVTEDNDNYVRIPDSAIERLARFFLPLMQASLSEKPPAHLQCKQKDDMMCGKEV